MAKLTLLAAVLFIACASAAPIENDANPRILPFGGLGGLVGGIAASPVGTLASGFIDGLSNGPVGNVVSGFVDGLVDGAPASPGGAPVVGPVAPGGAPVVGPVAPGGAPVVGPAAPAGPIAAGIGNGAVQNNGPAIGTGTGIVDAGPNGFGVALGIGGAIDTPFGTHTFGQGTAAAVPGIQLPFFPPQG